MGEAFEDDDTVVIAKMDATANDVPDKRFEVPSLLHSSIIMLTLVIPAMVFHHYAYSRHPCYIAPSLCLLSSSLR